jgi:hypothetical protein
MENVMFAQQQEIHRRPDGSIDIEFYRDKGLTERHAVIKDVFRNAVKARSAYIVAVIVAAAVSIVPSRVA